MFRNAPDPIQRVAREARRRAVALGCYFGSIRVLVLGPYVHALGDTANLAPLYAFVVGVLAQHYGRRLSIIRPSVATVGAILSVVLFCYCGNHKQPALILLLECFSA